MRILLISGGKGGVYGFTCEMAKILSRKGHDVHAVFVTGSQNPLKSLPPGIPSIFINYASEWKKLTGLARKGFDLVHTSFAAPIPFLLPLRKPVVFTCHGLPQPWLEPSLKQRMLFSVEKATLPIAFSKTAGTISVSKFVSAQLKSVYNVDSRVIYHGINLSDFPYANAREKQLSKRRLGIGSHANIILYVGTFHPVKDPITLVKAFHLVEKKLPDTHLILAGEGELYSRIVKSARNLSLCGKINIRRRPISEEICLFYHAADVFVLPSLSEAFGMVLLEAMASGVPCVVSDRGACAEILGKNGLVFAAGNHMDLGDKILRILENRNLGHKFALGAYERTQKVFSWDDAINEYEKIFLRLASRD